MAVKKSGIKTEKLMMLVMACICIMTWTSATQAQPLRVFVSIPPQRFFVKQIGSQWVDVEVMVPPGANPATYEPKPAQMVALTKAKIYFSIGVPFERVWLKKIAAASPAMRMVPTDEGIKKRLMKSHPHHEEGKSNRHERHHGIPDPHIWLSPPLVMVQARNILTAMVKTDPAHRSIYESNFKNLMKKLAGLHAELSRLLDETVKGKEFMVFHPSWGYFADAYGLVQVPLEIEGKEPKPAQLKAIIQHAKERGIRAIFVQPQFSTKSAAVMAKAMGGEVVFADPLAENWMENLRQQARKVKAALR
jgi:zinc transport system substrate-binding protein